MRKLGEWMRKLVHRRAGYALGGVRKLVKSVLGGGAQTMRGNAQTD
jgi:hypothetical protein